MLGFVSPGGHLASGERGEPEKELLTPLRVRTRGGRWRRRRVGEWNASGVKENPRYLLRFLSAAPGGLPTLAVTRIG